MKIKREKKNNLFINKKEDINKLIEDNVFNNAYIGFNAFVILDCLGAGSFGKVFKVRMKSNEEIYAMKVINKIF